MSEGYRVGLAKEKFVGGARPVYAVLTPDGQTFTAETAWGARRIIRMDKKARALDRKEAPRG